MAQVKVQTSAPLAGPGLSPGVPPTAMASPGSLGLQPSVNGTGPAPTPACPAPAGGFGDAPVSATSPGRSKGFSFGNFLKDLLLEDFVLIVFIIVFIRVQSKSDISQILQTMCQMQNDIFKDC